MPLPIPKAHLVTAARYSALAGFRKAHPEIAARLQRGGQLKELHDMFEDGSIQRYAEEKPDMRRKENRKSPVRTHPDDIARAALGYRTFTEFLRKSGPYASAARKTGQLADIRAYFDRELHTDEVIETATAFSSWGEFAAQRPRHAEIAEKQGLRDFLTAKLH